MPLRGTGPQTLVQTRSAWAGQRPPRSVGQIHRSQPCRPGWHRLSGSSWSGTGTALGAAVSTSAIVSTMSSATAVKLLTYGSLATGVVEFGLYSERGIKYQRERNEMMNSFIAGGGDYQTAFEMKEALDLNDTNTRRIVCDF